MRLNKFIQYLRWALIAAAFVVTLAAQTPGEDKLVGKWKLNISKSQYQGVPRPSEASLVISAASPSHFKFQVTTAFTDGGKTVWSDMGFDGAIDGQPYEYRGAQRGTVLSFVDHNGVIEGTAKYPSGTTMHETITISADGNTMTSPSSMNLPKGTASWTEVWERVPDKKRK
jgi:hypothetical protein